MPIREQIRYKSRKEMEKLREAGRLAANALRVAARAAKPGRVPAGAGQAGGDLHPQERRRPQLQGLPRLPRHPLHLRERPGGPRHPHPPTSSRRATSSPSTAGPSWTASTATPASPWAWARSANEARLLLQSTQLAMFKGIEYCRAGYRLGDMATAVQTFGEGLGYSIVREYIGHGIGRELHEDPQVVYADVAPRHRLPHGAGHDHHHRAHLQHRQPPVPGGARRLDGAHRRRQPLAPSSSTPWPSPRTAPGSSACPIPNSSWRTGFERADPGPRQAQPFPGRPGALPGRVPRTGAGHDGPGRRAGASRTPWKGSPRAPSPWSWTGPPPKACGPTRATSWCGPGASWSGRRAGNSPRACGSTSASPTARAWAEAPATPPRPCAGQRPLRPGPGHAALLRLAAEPGQRRAPVPPGRHGAGPGPGRTGLPPAPHPPGAHPHRPPRPLRRHPQRLQVHLPSVGYPFPAPCPSLGAGGVPPWRNDLTGAAIYACPALADVRAGSWRTRAGNLSCAAPGAAGRRATPRPWNGTRPRDPGGLPPGLDRLAGLGACPSNIRPRDGVWKPEYRAQGPQEV